MPGENRFLNKYRTSGLALQGSGTCVFISHKREDTSAAIAIAKTLETLTVDYWLDLEQLQGGQPSTQEEHQVLTEAIDLGLRNSSHLLAVITPRTQGSWWVPYELGMARSRTRKVAFFIHMDLPPDGWPSYFWCGERLHDQTAFYAWAQELSSNQQMAVNYRRLHELSPGPLDPFLRRQFS